MATNESGFKTQLREDLARCYQDSLVFTINDMFRAGLPDFSVLWRGSYIGIEGKFIQKLPLRETSKGLGHEVSQSQIEFLIGARKTGNYGVVIIGMPDVAVIMTEIKKNYTLGEILKAPRLERSCGAWQVKGLLEFITGRRIT